LHGKHGGGCDQKISFYFASVVGYSSIQPLRDVYGQALNRDIEELIQDIVSDVIKPDSGQSKRSRLPEHGY
jgi:hypothetical protein